MPTGMADTSSKPAEESSTRQRLIDAAVECILDEGYYRASSNQIARRAGVTWGVIQHHFRTREGLLLAVVRDGADHLVETIANAEIHGSTNAERIGALADVVWSHYRRPEFLVGVQIIMNLSRDPTTATETTETLADLDRRMMGRWQRLVDQVVDPARQPPGLSVALFDILRGVAVGGELIDSMVGRRPKPVRDRRVDRDTLLRALTLLLDDVVSDRP